MNLSDPIFIAGHRGLVGSALVRNLKEKGYNNLLLRTRDELDLRNQAAVQEFFKKEKPAYVYLAAARVGGIYANDTYQADFLYENLILSLNIMQAALENGTEKLLFLGSSCIYPKLAPQPIREDSLLTGALEPTNEGYAIAKIAGLKFCEKIQRQHKRRFISAMPTNLYGPNDNFHPMNSHVIPGMMRRFHEARTRGDPEVIVWGTGTPKREFLHVDDLAEALFVLMKKYEEPTTINIGTGQECTVAELAHTMKDVTGCQAKVTFDSTKPDGTMRKVLDSSRILSLGWKPKYSLVDGLRHTYQWTKTSNAFD